ncbi:hypothetical protein AAVH_43369, partial [Aphelenchoides avenae]
MPSAAEIVASVDSGPTSRAATKDFAQFAEDDVAMTTQAHEHMKQRILDLQEELQRKDSLLEVSEKRAQVTAGIISSLRDRLQAQ